MYSQPLCLVPGSNFGGVVRVYAGENGPNRLDVSFDLDTIEEWIDAYQIKENCTCTWAETDHDDCSCGLVAIELRVRQDAHSSFTECDGMFGKDAVVEVWVLAGRLRAIFETVNRHLSTVPVTTLGATPRCLLLGTPLLSPTSSSRRSLPPPTTRVSICLPNSSTDDFFFKMFLEKKQSK